MTTNIICILHTMNFSQICYTFIDAYPPRNPWPERDGCFTIINFERYLFAPIRGGPKPNLYAPICPRLYLPESLADLGR